MLGYHFLYVFAGFCRQQKKVAEIEWINFGEKSQEPRWYVCKPNDDFVTFP